LSDEEEPPGGGVPEALLLLVMVLAGGVLFLAFSFLTFGLPLVALALGAVIWIYVGVMKTIDRWWQ
jgi:hypothetical protein